MLPGCGGGSVPAPTSYKTWNAKDGTFQFPYPAGWEARGGGKHGIQWANIEKGSALIRVDINLSDSVIGDIGEAVSSGRDSALGEMGAELDEELTPVAQVHELRKDEIIEKQGYKDYEELNSENYQPRLGPARRSEFTAKKGMGRKVHGYRATILAHNNGVRVICHCNESDWAHLQAAFKKALDEMEMGQRR